MYQLVVDIIFNSEFLSVSILLMFKLFNLYFSFFVKHNYVHKKHIIFKTNLHYPQNIYLIKQQDS